MYVFFVQLEPDIDHIAPIAYRLAKERPGHVTIVSTNILWDIEADYRLRDLHTVHQVPIAYIHRLGGGRYLGFAAMELLLRLPRWALRAIPSALWSAFYFKVSGSVVTADGATSYLRSIGARAVVVDDAQPNAAAIFAATQRLGIPMVTVQTANCVLVPSQSESPAPLADTDYMVIPNTLTQPYVSDTRIKVLGCMRYCREWQEVNTRLLSQSFPGEDLPDEIDKLKVLVFGWAGRDFDADHSTVRNLAKLNYVELIFKARPRTTTPRKIYEFNYTRYPSARLIMWADVVVTSVTSIALDALHHDKTLIYLKYISPEDTATFESYDAVWTVNTETEFFDALETLRKEPNYRPYDSNNVHRFVEDAVYAGDQEKDVLGQHAGFLTDLVEHPLAK